MSLTEANVELPQRDVGAGAPLRIGAFLVEADGNQVHLHDRTFALEPLVMDVLCLLAERAGEVVLREEIISHVWLARVGSDESLTRAIAILRRLFGHDASGQEYIKTVWKRGYVLVAEVRPDSERALEVITPAYTCEQAPVPSYSVAVLPFANASSDISDAFLADGITRDLTMLLCRVPRLRVAAYSSSLLIREGEESLPQIAQRLGVRYAVSGSLARSGDKFQLRLALMDAEDDAQVWARRVDAPLTEFYRVQDDIVLDVSTSLASALQVSHAASIQGRRPFQLTAYELVQRAEALRLRYNRDTAREIIGLLDRALVLDPEDATVHAALAVQHTQNVVSSFVRDAEQTFALARKHVEAALSIAPADPEALAAAGIAATMMGNARLAVRQLEQAVETDPNNPHTLAVLGWQHSWLYANREGIAMIEKAEARAPHHPRYAVWAHYRGHCEIKLGEVDRAIRAYEDGAARNPAYGLNLVTLTAAHEFAGNRDRADEALARVMAANPAYRPADLETLARRMIYWFGTSPTRAEFTDAFRAAWERRRAA